MLHDNFETPISGIEEKYTFHDLSKIAHRNKNLLSSICGYIQANSFQNKETEHKNTDEDFNELGGKLMEFYFKFYFNSLQDEFFTDPQKVEPIVKKLIIDHEKVVYFIKQQLDIFEIESSVEKEIKNLLLKIESVIRSLRNYLPDFKQKFKGLDELKRETIKNTSSNEPKKLYDFFDEVIESEISDIEIYNYIEKATNNFDEVKTKLILKDLDFYLFSYKMELESEFDLNDLVGKDKKYKSFDEIPYRNIKNIETGEIDKTFKSYDYEKLFYPYHFFNLYQLRKLILSKVDKSTPPLEPSTPFNTKQQKDIFDYLNKNWVNTKPIRYAYIYKFMTDEINLKIDFTTYNKFIISKHGKKVQRNNASRKDNYEQLRELMEEYDN